MQKVAGNNSGADNKPYVYAHAWFLRSLIPTFCDTSLDAKGFPLLPIDFYLIILPSLRVFHHISSVFFCTVPALYCGPPIYSELCPKLVFEWRAPFWELLLGVDDEWPAEEGDVVIHPWNGGVGWCVDNSERETGPPAAESSIAEQEGFQVSRSSIRVSEPILPVNVSSTRREWNLEQVRC